MTTSTTTGPRVLVIQTSGQHEIVTLNVDDGMTLTHLQTLVGGYIEAISPADRDDWFCYGNEEAKIIGLPYNIVATHLAHRLGWPHGDVLNGPIVFLSCDDEGDSQDVPAIVLDTLRTMIN
jgi:Domain of unknown function (DUF3846)